MGKPILDPKTVQKQTSDDGFQLAILGDTKAAACVKKSTDGSLQITAPQKVFKTGPLELLASHLMSAIGTEVNLEKESFSVKTGLVIDTHRQCQAIVLVECPHAIDGSRSSAVICALLEKLKNRDLQSEALFASKEGSISNETVDEIDASATAILSTCGGTPILAPATILVGSQTVGQLKGMYAPRPDLSNLTPEPIEVIGRFDGFRLKKRSIFIDSEEQPILAHWEFDEQLVSVLDLAKNPQSPRKFLVNKTIDQRGQPVYTLLRWSDCQ